MATELFGAEREYLEALPARAAGLLSQPVSGEGTPSHWASESDDAASTSGKASISTTASDGMECQEAWESHWASESSTGSASISGTPSASALPPVPADGAERHEALEAALALMRGLPKQLEEDLRQQGFRAARQVGDCVRGLCEELPASRQQVDCAPKDLGAGQAQAPERLGSKFEPTASLTDAAVAKTKGFAPAQHAFGGPAVAASLPRTQADSAREAWLCHPVPTEAVVHDRSSGRHKAGQLPKVAATHGRQQVDRAPKDLGAGQAQGPERLRCQKSSAKFEPTAILTAAEVAKTKGLAPAQHAFSGPAVAASLQRPQADSAREAPVPPPATNPGSIGHPYLCTRPCVFFLRNACANGSECNYCHLEVDGRGNHLDKMGREQFKGLDFPKRVQLAMPLLRQRAAGLRCPGLQGFLDEFELSSKTEACLASTSPWPSAAARHKLHRSLYALSFRAVLTHVCRGEDTPAWLRGSGVQDRLSRVVAGHDL